MKEEKQAIIKLCVPGTPQNSIVGLLVDRVIVNKTGADVLIIPRQGYVGQVRSDGLHSLVDELDTA